MRLGKAEAAVGVLAAGLIAVFLVPAGYAGLVFAAAVGAFAWIASR